MNIKFREDEIRKFLFSTRFLFQNLNRVIFFDINFNIIGDTDTLDLDPRSFSQGIDEIKLEIINQKNLEEKNNNENINKKKKTSLKDTLYNYSISKDFERTNLDVFISPFTIVENSNVPNLKELQSFSTS